MANDSSSGVSLGGLIVIAVLIAAVVFWRFSLVAVGVLVLAGVLAWAGHRFLSKSGRAAAAIEARDYAAGLRLLQEGGDGDALISALRFKVPFPTETVKARLLAAVRELLELRAAAADPANTHLPEELRRDIVRRCGESLASLWPLCQKLALVARAKADTAAIAPRLAAVGEELDALANNATATRHQLAHLTLGADELEIHAATEQVGAMKWQVSEMQKLDAMLEG
jgi:hypothetical protein